MGVRETINPNKRGGGSYPQKANIRMKARFITPPATSALPRPEIIRCPNVLEKRKKAQQMRNKVKARESTESVQAAFLSSLMG
jgi:hypothetical protein